MSQQLGVLERECGVPLLEKRGRTLELTAAGRLLVDHAEVLLADLARAEAELAALRGGSSGTVRIAAFPSVARAIVARLWTATADLDLRLVEHEPEPAIDALLTRAVDVAVVHAYSVLPRDCPTAPGCRCSTIRCCSPCTPTRRQPGALAPGQPVALADLAERPWLVPGGATSCHEMVQRACGAAGFVPRAVAGATDFSVLAALVEAGAGVALMPRMTIPADARNLRVHPLAQPVTRSISALVRSGEGGHPRIRSVIERLVAATAAYTAGTGR